MPVGVTTGGLRHAAWIGAVGLVSLLRIFADVPAVYGQSCPPIGPDPPPEIVQPPSFFKFFGPSPSIPASIPLNGTTTLTFVLRNPNCVTPLTGISFTDQLPPGLVVATPNGLTQFTPLGPAPGCGSVTAAPGSATISLTNGFISAFITPGPEACGFTLNVRATTAGTKLNTTSALTTANSPPGLPTTAVLEVVVVPIPTLSPWASLVLAILLAGVALRVLRMAKRPHLPR